MIDLLKRRKGRNSDSYIETKKSKNSALGKYAPSQIMHEESFFLRVAPLSQRVIRKGRHTNMTMSRFLIHCPIIVSNFSCTIHQYVIYVHHTANRSALHVISANSTLWSMQKLWVIAGQFSLLVLPTSKCTRVLFGP